MPILSLDLLLDPIQISLFFLLAAAVVLYVGSRLLWASIASAGLWRGVAMGLPLIAIALFEAVHSPAIAVAVVVSSAVLALTLGLGVSTLDVSAADACGTPLFRSLLPLAATVCLAGFHGELSWPIGLAIAVVGGLTLWTADGERVPIRATARPWFAVPAAVLLLVGLALLAYSTSLFRQASHSSAPTPVVVLLTVPAICLALLGLLTAEAREHRPQTPQETATGLAVATLGIGLPAVIFVGTFWPPALARLATITPALANFVSTQPADPAVLMPLSTWRVDSVLLVVVSILLLPIGTGRMKLGRAEGMALIILFICYAAVATRTGTLTG